MIYGTLQRQASSQPIKKLAEFQQKERLSSVFPASEVGQWLKQLEANKVAP